MEERNKERENDVLSFVDWFLRVFCWKSGGLIGGLVDFAAIKYWRRM